MVRRLLLTLVLIAGLLAFYKGAARYQQRHRQELPREWHGPAVPGIGPASAVLRTTCHGRALRFQLVLTSSDTAGFSPDSLRFTHFVVSFRDSAGFEIFKKEVPMRSMVRSLDDEGRVLELSTDQRAICYPAVYDRLGGWSLARTSR